MASLAVTQVPGKTDLAEIIAADRELASQVRASMYVVDQVLEMDLLPDLNVEKKKN